MNGCEARFHTQGSMVMLLYIQASHHNVCCAMINKMPTLSVCECMADVYCMEYAIMSSLSTSEE